MASTKIASEPAKFGSQPNIIGPVHRDDPAPSQSLLDSHRKFAANYTAPTKETAHKAAHDPRQNRVLGGGARTPRSLAAQIQRQVERNEATK
ncbi:unnamed protein product [Clonostachys rosea f. rosea IK726]|uniref:Uncharacterized protein n=6 Tax=Bionectria ochroleuca TaxID=29856 RepID=A0ACA9TN93_BIOOC|nr:unnamed protein product [Clonostachys rosea f. rosea IK726]CAG9951214.1 unnamed protein product [Clonostachys rosea f. rosea IK726]CAG9951218.1 unnamed protein product [Clonostachys rosea f. rosea IK726]CAG9951247.1 unnamed protein product [Clonostachys rosea f. rosea IK726]CAG9951252.1 unnamed protein product [Clonostachys rosea f. rosea IK726]